ncbi:hypothetical protein Cch01nite_16010 [Cellulomonas chitinilytica]|uniref:LppX_LprAFG lipoprotein n=1 Tax=Cellulomonas chitinilytica TaxID=398759 RepID=A0A919P0A9_9CELL|nr:hypothetical protein [Cellulomonas chitinilytica]GIG20877.1 hypothetical protein Cch01nite_16010 [Cellulomonas chitinilytica]
MPSYRRLLALPVAACLAWTLTACGGGAGGAAEGASPDPVETASATATPEAPELTLANFVDTLTAAQNGTGSYDFSLAITAEGQEIVATGSANVADGAQDVAMTMSYPGAGDFDIRIVGGVMYMSMGDLTGGKFLQIDPNDATNPLSAGLGDITGDIDPAKTMAAQKVAITEVTKTGEPEQLDGVEVQQYVVVVDPSKLDAEQRKPFDEAAAAGVPLPATLTYTYWVDSANLIHKVAFDIGAKTEMTFSNWGAGAPVVAPTADQITTENPFGA